MTISSENIPQCSQDDPDEKLLSTLVCHPGLALKISVAAKILWMTPDARKDAYRAILNRVGKSGNLGLIRLVEEAFRERHADLL